MSTKVPTPTPGTKPMTPTAVKPTTPAAAPTRAAAPTMPQPMTSAPTASCATANAPTFCMTPAHQQIAQRAYERWIKRGRPHGTHLQDWFEAEAELKREISAKAGQKS